MANTYHSKLNKRYAAKLRVLEGQLPYFCTQYFNSKSLIFEKQTAFAYATDLRIFFTFLRDYLPELSDKDIKDIPVSILDELSEDDLKAYTSFLDDNRENGENGIQRKLSSVKSLCKYLIKKELINRNPIDLIDMPKIHRKPIITLSDNEIDKLFNVIEHETGMTDYQTKHNKKCVSRDYAIMMLFLGTGMRISELVGVDTTDINFEENTIRIVRKGGNEQILYFDEQVGDALTRYLGIGKYKGYPYTRASFEPDDNEKALFLSRRKTRLSVRGIQCLIEKYSKLAFGKPEYGNKIHAHLFRKTYGTGLYLDEGDIKLVADTLGHSSISTTAKHYVVSDEEHKRKAARKVLKNRKII